MIDAHRSLASALALDAVVYSYTLFAFVLHALSSFGCDSDAPSPTEDAASPAPAALHVEYTFAVHDEPLLLLHTSHVVLVVAGTAALSCSSERARAFWALAALAALVAAADLSAALVHAVSSSDHGHSRPIRYVYVALAAALCCTASLVCVRARRLERLLAPPLYAMSAWSDDAEDADD